MNDTKILQDDLDSLQAWWSSTHQSASHHFYEENQTHESWVQASWRHPNYCHISQVPWGPSKQ